jgi:hypothetical protein
MTYKIQINDTVRDATPQEAAALDAARTQSEETIAAYQAQIAARESALAKLAALGLTEDEVNALIGGM